MGKFNMGFNKTPMKMRDPKVRIKDFFEVDLGYTEEEAINEANRCLQCSNPGCVKGCPVNNNIPAFIKQITLKNYIKAHEILLETSSLPAVCGRVCPKEEQCEKNCIRALRGEPVAIGRLERFVADYFMEHNKEIKINLLKNNKKVAVIGSGPAGITCAWELRKMGYDVTIFEALHVEGGVLSYGMPEFRLPKNIVRREIDSLKKIGVEIIKNVVVGKSITLKDIFDDGYQAIFIGTGAGVPKFMGILGEDLNGVYFANEFLTRINLMKLYYNKPNVLIKVGETLGVIGAGNIAIDVARSALRLGVKKVYIIYRRTINEITANLEEVEHARNEGVEFLFLTKPVEILGKDGWVSGIKLIKTKLVEDEKLKIKKPVSIPGSEYELKLDNVVVAIGQSPNTSIIRASSNLLINNEKQIIVDPYTMETNIENVYAGGDIVTGAATVILAMGTGKKAAMAIDKRLKAK